ncbi:hypothetical protein [Glaciimonas sp. PAMC28666]|uniref:hypothetical protein n=1 Tax=Glaciimonas sp. PAMC28666 TaxID=2807626 RepID=UPI001962F06C|nr:hypothetical protein [Glaciimonas sp. PAMC28666]QRX81742.1 hypothetical protein JQN73_16550 [Glaciimonas sp. PAMC28666]
MAIQVFFLRFDLIGMMAARGILISYLTIMAWVQRYVYELEKRWNRYAYKAGR